MVLSLSLAALVAAQITQAQTQTTPAQPTGLTATAPGSQERILNWDDPSDSALTGYQYRQKTGSDSCGGWMEIIAAQSGNAQVILHWTDPDNSAISYYQVQRREGSDP